MRLFGRLPLVLAALLHCGSNPKEVTHPSAEARTRPPPVTPKRPVTDEYWGTKVIDPYRWLENADDPEVKAWILKQNAYAREFLDGAPHYAEIHARVAQIMEHESPDYFALTLRPTRAPIGRPATMLFALKEEPPKQQPFLVAIESVANPEERARVVVDPNVIDPSGGTAIDWYVPSLDGKLVAVSMSHGGSESGSLHVYDATTGKERGDVVPRAHGGTAGGSLAWNADGTGFYYTRYPHAGERAADDLDFYQQIYFHKLGEKPEADTYALGRDFPRIAEIQLSTSDDGRYVLASVANGDGGDFAYYVGSGSSWTQLAEYGQKIVHAEFGREDRIYLISHDGAPRGKVLRVRAGDPKLATAETIVPEREGSIAEIEVTATKLWVKKLAGGPSTLEAYPLDTKPSAATNTGGVSIAIPPISQVNHIVHLRGDAILFRDESYVSPPAWYEYAFGEPSPRLTGMRTTSPADFSDSEATISSCTSKDGTRVPITIVRQKTANGSGPALLNGYGGYGVSQEPRFRAYLRVFVEQGGTYAVANVRGGAELGETWHEQGKLTHKQNVFDDFAACAKLMLEKYALKNDLAIIGGSNGGLLMGAELTLHPEMFRAVVSLVGIYDMLRVELAPNGAFNVTEFGTVKDKAQFEALYGYSPLHHVKDGVPYPAVLMMTGANDPRVDPYHSRKMTAALQAATSSGLPILLRTSSNTGHGIGTPLDAAIVERTDILAFLFRELGIQYAPAR